MKSVPSNVQLPKMEEEVLSFWNDKQIFEKSNEIRKGQKEFAFYDGPPFANGLPHYGHLLANTIKDTVPRYWNMRGYDVDRRFGWDTHGVPVEFEVEKNEGLSGRQDILDMGVDVFNEKCRESVLHYAEEWQKTIVRLGRWVDWNRQYRTMDTDFMESVWWVFHSLYEKGLVYQGYKVVPYSPRITAVLSNFEANQNYQDVQDPAITVKFKLKDEEASILAWTTTPWTLISNLALAVGEEITYAKIKANEDGQVYYLAEDLLRKVFKKSKKEKTVPYEVLETIPGKELVGRSYEPLFPYFKDHGNSFQVIAAEFVTTDEGTGIVHLAPAYGEDDFFACQKMGIELVDPLDDEAKYKDSIPEYKGQFVKDADKNIIKDLKEAGKLLRHDTLVHSYPMCERTNGPLIYRAIPSWYVAVEKFKSQLVENNKTINWVPGHLKEGRMGKWLENARDWAISRNRFWGTPIPIWVCENDDSHVYCMKNVEDLKKRSGRDIDDLHKHYIDDITIDCECCDGKMKRISEVFDCWFESGSMPYAQLHYPYENKERFEENFPADFIAEGLDQTRGWFYTLSVLSAALFQRPAFKNVVVNGLVLADDGRKMSKRWRNFTPPVDLINEFGADSVRLYMLNSAILRGEDLKFKNDGVKDTTRAVILPVWNSLSFLTTYAAADGWKPESRLVQGAAPEVKSELDRWVISRFHTLVEDLHKEMEAYKLYNVVPQVIGFIEDLTNWYIRQSRRKFWGGQETLSQETKDAYETLFYVLVNFMKVFAPFAPFTAEKVYKQLTDGIEGVPESVHLCDMPEAQTECIDSGLERKMELTRTVAELGRSLRAKHQIKTRQVLPGMLIISRSEEDQKKIQEGADVIKAELNLKELTFSTDEAQFVNLSLKPNLRTLGKRLGKKLKEFRSHLEGLSQDPSKIAAMLGELEANGKIVILDEELEIGDFLIERGPKDDRLIATGLGVTVLLDTELTPELIREGLAREVVNRIQNLRKDSKLVVTDKIAIKFSGSDNITTAVKEHQTYICGETQADSLALVADNGVDTTFVESFDIGEDSCKIGIQTV